MIYFSTIHLLILATFVIGTTVLSVVTLGNIMRLRNVKMSWKSGKLFGYPLFATLFLGFSLILTSMSLYQGMSHLFLPALGYNIIGMNWFMTSFLVSKRYVTDYGIVKNINDPAQTVPWSRIMDYMEKNTGIDMTYVFFYPDFLNQARPGNIRLELTVPSGIQPSFQQMIQTKLGRKFSLGQFQQHGIEQLK